MPREPRDLTCDRCGYHRRKSELCHETRSHVHADGSWTKTLRRYCLDGYRCRARIDDREWEKAMRQ